MNPAPVAEPARGTRRRWRAVLRWGALVIAVILAWPWRTDASGAAVVPALSPFVAAGSVLALRTAGAMALLALPVWVLALLYPRWFCRHACPTGLLQETLEQWGRRSVRAEAGRGLPSRTGVANDQPPRRHAVPAIGAWLVALTIGGACVGYPLFLWLDPLALFHGFLNAGRAPLSPAQLAAGLGLPLLLGLNLLVPRLWCQRLCPLGATQELLTWSRRRLWPRTRGRPAGGQGADGLRLTRRLFVGSCAGAAGALWINHAHAQHPAVLRPPGALAGPRFTGLCVRCGNCAQACPSRIIQPDFGGSGLAGWLTPRLSFEADYCREDCDRCGRVCPSGAIERLSLAEKRRRIIGPAQVDRELCLLAQGRECTACLKRCPYDALVLSSPDGGFTNEPRVELSRCTGCGACEVVCPVRPQRAIRVRASRAGARALGGA